MLNGKETCYSKQYYMFIENEVWQTHFMQKHYVLPGIKTMTYYI